MPDTGRSDVAHAASAPYSSVRTRPREDGDPIDGLTGPTAPLVVTVIGAGYVGLVTSACLSSLQHVVRCVDVDQARIDSLLAGRVPFNEPGLAPLIRSEVDAGRLTFGVDAIEAATGADIVFIAVGTLDGTGRWTDRYVRAAIETLLRGPSVPPLLAVRSTLRPGRMAELHELVRASGRATTLLLNPEFTSEGSAIGDFLAPDRIVIGVPSGASAEVAEPLVSLY